jgi:hypothetical protein
VRTAAIEEGVAAGGGDVAEDGTRGFGEVDQTAPVRLALRERAVEMVVGRGSIKLNQG